MCDVQYDTERISVGALLRTINEFPPAVSLILSPAKAESYSNARKKRARKPNASDIHRELVEDVAKEIDAFVLEYAIDYVLDFFFLRNTASEMNSEELAARLREIYVTKRSKH